MLRRLDILFAFSAVCILAQQQAAVSLSVNGAADAVVDPGWPVLIAAIAATPSDTAADVRNLNAMVVGVDGQPVPVTLTRAPIRDPVQSAGFTVATATWTISPEATAAMPTGHYTVQVTGAPSVGFDLRVPGTEENAARRAERLMVFSEYAELAGDREKAVGYTDELLRLDAGSIAARIRKADLLAADGKLAEALRLLDEADMLVRKQNPTHPPIQIRKRQAEILDQMTGR